MAGVLRRNRISLVFGSMLAWHIPGVATLAMLPDFQHRNYPRLFTAEERERRDHQFAMCAQLATRIVLLSHSAAADHARYLPAFSHKARVLQPVCMLAPGVFAEGPEPLIRRYDLPERFIFCPNQFWQHKNHQLAFEAVRILRDRGVQVHLVCSGNPTDYRHPQHYPAQMNWIESQGLSSHIRHLGLVPLTDVHQLMRQSLAVFSPSRHEGWGMAVDEARSIGKRLLLSEIPAHREQDPPNARYFDPDDAEGLAEAMAWIVAVAEPGPDPRMEHQARQNHAARIACYAQGFLEVAQEAISEVRVDRAPAARSVPD